MIKVRKEAAESQSLPPRSLALLCAAEKMTQNDLWHAAALATSPLFSCKGSYADDASPQRQRISYFCPPPHLCSRGGGGSQGLLAGSGWLRRCWGGRREGSAPHLGTASLPPSEGACQWAMSTSHCLLTLCPAPGGMAKPPGCWLARLAALGAASPPWAALCLLATRRAGHQSSHHACWVGPAGVWADKGPQSRVLSCRSWGAPRAGARGEHHLLMPSSASAPSSASPAWMSASLWLTHT